tara:strand:- start:3440 stop:4192 length:753 start_codon:yes stop_codon:yes gene_type:complete
MDIEKKYVQLLCKRWMIYWDILGLKDYKRRIENRIARRYGKEGIESLSKLVDLKNKKVLDVGSGCGEFIFEAVLKGAKGYGVEPEKEGLEISKLLFKIHKKKVTLKQSFAEDLPFEDNTFDVIISNSTIEHVRDPEKALKEMVRVLKPKGVIWLKCPNFIYPLERHYKKFYIPLLPNWIQQKYFNFVSGKKSKYYYSLNEITPFFVLKFLRKHQLKYKNISLEKDLKKNLFRKILAKIHLYTSIEFLIEK